MPTVTVIDCPICCGVSLHLNILPSPPPNYEPSISKSVKKSVESLKPNLWDGLIAGWLFNENAGSTVYDILNLNNASMLNATWNSANMSTGHNISFSGDNGDYISVNRPIIKSNQLTIALKMRTDSGSGINKVVCGQITNSSDRMAQISVGNPNTTIQFIPRIGGTSRTVSAIMSSEQWTSIVGTYDGQTVRLYIDGVESGSPISVTGPIDNVDVNNYSIGAHSTGFSAWMGLIEYNLLWDRALTPQEVLSIHTHPYKMFYRKPVYIPTASSTPLFGMLPPGLMQRKDMSGENMSNEDLYGESPKLNKNLVSMISRYNKARREWIAAGKPLRTSKDMAYIYDNMCAKCPQFTGHSCNICGCRIARSGHMLNKLAWLTEQCPDNPPKWLAFIQGYPIDLSKNRPRVLRPKPK